MKVRTIKKRIKALKGKFNVGINYVGVVIACGQPTIHKHGISVDLKDIEIQYIPWTDIRGAEGLTEDEV